MPKKAHKEAAQHREDAAAKSRRRAAELYGQGDYEIEKKHRAAAHEYSGKRHKTFEKRTLHIAIAK